MIRIHLKSALAFGFTLAVSGVALVMSGVQAVGRAQDEAEPLMPDDLEVGFSSADYHEAICNAVELLADERALCFEECDFEEWARELMYGEAL